MMTVSVTPKWLQANGLWNPLTGNKKWQITCGGCEHTWKEAVPVMEPSSAICPSCRTQNKWSVRVFMNIYDAQLEPGLPGVPDNV